MLDHIIGAGRVNVEFARKLLADVPDENMCLQPMPGVNHAAWVMGHLAFVFDSMNRVWGHAPTMAADWVALYKPGSTPSTDRALYASKAALWESYQATFDRLVASVQAAEPEAFAREFPNPKLRPMLPTIGVAMAHVLTSHQGLHLGQLSTWRRMQGLPGVLF